MNIIDILQMVVSVMTIIISVLGIIQSVMANRKSNKANEVAEKALKDSQKDYMPLVRFTGEFVVTKKTIKTLRNENTFDFDGVVLSLRDPYNEDFYEEYDELPCITAEIENCGEGFITGLTIKEFFVQSGNKFSLDIKSQDELDTLCVIQQECSEWFVLMPGQTATVNFVMFKDVYGINECDSIDDLYVCMKEFEQNNDNIMIKMDFHIKSLNNTSYYQDYLAGTYLDGNIVHNSFDKVINYQ